MQTGLTGLGPMDTPESTNKKIKKHLSINSMDNGWSISADQSGPDGYEQVELVFTSKPKLIKFVGQFLFEVSKKEE